MSFINIASREINCKIVYYGPGLCGKTTNLQYIYGHTNPDAKGKMISLATETDRTLFFDFLPLDLGTIRGFTTRFTSTRWKPRNATALCPTTSRGAITSASTAIRFSMACSAARQRPAAAAFWRHGC